MKYKEFLKSMEEAVMEIGNVADRLGISIDEVKSWEKIKKLIIKFKINRYLLDFEEDLLAKEYSLIYKIKRMFC